MAMLFNINPGRSSTYEKNRKTRLYIKKNMIPNMVKTNIGQKLVNNIVLADDFIQELASLEIEISVNNFVSKTIRKWFGLVATTDIESMAGAQEYPNAKSKWHEIVNRAESVDPDRAQWKPNITLLEKEQSDEQTLRDFLPERFFEAKKK